MGPHLAKVVSSCVRVSAPLSHRPYEDPAMLLGLGLRSSVLPCDFIRPGIGSDLL
jgi:hypothetical protein